MPGSSRYSGWGGQGHRPEGSGGRGHKPPRAAGRDGSDKGILDFFDVVEGSARSLEPHRLTFYLIDLVARFHSYYNKARVLGNAPALTLARLALLKVLQQVIREGLQMLGVSAPEKMERTEEPSAG